MGPWVTWLLEIGLMFLFVGVLLVYDYFLDLWKKHKGGN